MNPIKIGTVFVFINALPSPTQIARPDPIDRLPGYGRIFPIAIFNWELARLGITIMDDDMYNYPEECQRLLKEIAVILQEIMDTHGISSNPMDMARVENALPYLRISHTPYKQNFLSPPSNRT